ncbi:MRP17 [[Candida] subhashii]|uniref:Small ribosomal subunit protein bS6m n=1 Tax=[Candida] subhashii TaxID=561895 RepID=A0A8J5UN91_9ASCO|nr:MRP17 [[Candida] subhashii]KAG7663512.1 MRP17 [[Candida] subhashii]
MYYELLAIARITDPANVSKEATRIASTVGRLILNNRGVIREITSIGAKPLPRIMKKEQERHFQGYHFLIGFDSSGGVQSQLLRTLRNDPRVLRAIIKKHDITSAMNPGNSVHQALNSIPK